MDHFAVSNDYIQIRMIYECNDFAMSHVQKHVQNDHLCIYYINVSIKWPKMCMCISHKCVYICMCIYVCVYMYVYINMCV